MGSCVSGKEDTNTNFGSSAKSSISGGALGGRKRIEDEQQESKNLPWELTFFYPKKYQKPI